MVGNRITNKIMQEKIMQKRNTASSPEKNSCKVFPKFFSREKKSIQEISRKKQWQKYLCSFRIPHPTPTNFLMVLP